MNTSREVAQRIDTAIVAAERNRSWVARKAAIALTTLNRKLDGGADFTVSEVRRIAVALRIPVASLFPDEYFDTAKKAGAAA